jgi:hypothetical protein
MCSRWKNNFDFRLNLIFFYFDSKTFRAIFFFFNSKSVFVHKLCPQRFSFANLLLLDLLLHQVAIASVVRNDFLEVSHAVIQQFFDSRIDTVTVASVVKSARQSAAYRCARSSTKLLNGVISPPRDLVWIRLGVALTGGELSHSNSNW